MGLAHTKLQVRSHTHCKYIYADAETCSALLGVPIAVYYVALHNLPDDPDEKKDDDDHHEFFHFHGFDKVWKARLISLAAWIAVMIVVFVPMKIWKAKVCLSRRGCT